MIVDKYGNELVPSKPTHPGYFLSIELQARKIKQNDFANRAELQDSIITEILNGTRAITPDYAVKFENVLQIPASYWLNFQSQYELDLVRVAERNKQNEINNIIWNSIEEAMPIKIFKKLGFFNGYLKENIQQAFNLCNVKDIDRFTEFVANDNLDVAFFRKSEKLSTDKKHLFGWKCYAKFLARKIDLEQNFDVAKIDDLTQKLNALFLRNENLKEETKNLLNDYGIKFLIVEKFDKVFADGLSFFEGKNPTIVLTCRYNRLDNFAFNIMHELSHIKNDLTANSERSFVKIDGVEENKADNLARNTLIKPEIYKKLKSLINNTKYKDIVTIIEDFAKQNNIPPAILMGRWHYENECYKIGKNLIEKIG